MKKPSFPSVLLLFLLGMILFTSCQHKKPLEFTYKSVSESTLTYHRPVELDFSIEKKGKYDISLEMVYDETKLSWDGEHEAANAPLFIRLTGPTPKDVVDLQEDFELLTGLGWRGAKVGSGTERRINKMIYKAPNLTPGKYTLSVFSNAKYEDAEFPIHGVNQMGIAVEKLK
ncbi:MAG: hypothetical protein H6581_26560 [Bacteroidia bacterium]|nr:hypothetical protein [Bacteroidia bacterium]